VFPKTLVTLFSPAIKPPRRPLFWAALAFGAGVAVGDVVWRPALWWVVASMGFLAAAAFFAKRRLWLAFPLALGSLFFIGAVQIQLRNAQQLPGTKNLAFSDVDDTFVTAHVTHEGEIRDGSYGGSRQSIDVETEQVETQGATQAIRAGLRSGIYSKESDPEYQEDDVSSPMRSFHYGERSRFPVKLRVPRNFRNPGAFDYQGYLADNGIVVLGSTHAAKVEVLPGFVGTRVASWRERIHHSVVRKIHALWAADDAALMDAAVIGESAFLTPETKMDFQRSGTYHILVVSGMNVSILAFVVFWVMRRLRFGDTAASVLTVLLCTGYAFVTNVGPPVWRAFLMLTVYLGVRWLYRERSMLNALGAAASAVMVFDPKSFLGPSFQLTFLAVFLVAAIAVPCLERTSQPYVHGLRHLDSTEFDRALPPRVAQMRLDLRLVSEWLKRFILSWDRVRKFPLQMLGWLARGTLNVYELPCVSLLMQLGMALPMAYYFHRVTGDGHTGECARSSADRVAHAGGGAGGRAGVGVGGGDGAARNHWNRAAAGRISDRGSPGRDAGDLYDRHGECGAGSRDGARVAPENFCGEWAGRAGRRRYMDQRNRTTATLARPCDGGNGDRCRTERLDSGDLARRKNAARGRWRSSSMW